MKPGWIERAMPVREHMHALTAAVLLSCAQGHAHAQPGARAVPDRGQLLYEAHCVECHTTQMHWREGRVARDWDGLRAEVHAWQGRMRLDWPPEDVDAVARYLNDTIYRHPVPRAVATGAAHGASLPAREH